MRTILLLVLLQGVGVAQRLDLKPLDKLSVKATDSVDVKLDGPLLQLAARLLSSDDRDEARIKKLVAGLTGVYVKSYEFAAKGQYVETDLDGIRAQLASPAWSKVVAVKSQKDGENTEIYLRVGAKDQVGGLAIISAEPMELTIVQIVGTINVDDLRDLAGNFGIPEKLKKETK
jgi:Domain of unknown function (DUF4252)